MPNLLLGLFGFPEYSEVWVRVVGLAVLVLGYYYTRLGFAGFRPFFEWTVPVRIGQFFFFAVLVGLGHFPPMILLFAGTETAAGLWTLFALRGERS